MEGSGRKFDDTKTEERGRIISTVLSKQGAVAFFLTYSALFCFNVS